MSAHWYAFRYGPPELEMTCYGFGTEAEARAWCEEIEGNSFALVPFDELRELDLENHPDSCGDLVPRSKILEFKR